jgi:DNA-binding transcriptional regulator YiaG
VGRQGLTSAKKSETPWDKWETDAKKPGSMALKLLMIVQKHGLEMLA